jgi:hypothetical protein
MAEKETVIVPLFHHLVLSFLHLVLGGMYFLPVELVRMGMYFLPVARVRMGMYFLPVARVRV